MIAVLFWFGVLHAVLYAFAGSSIATWFCINWTVARFKLQREILSAYGRTLKERREAKGNGFVGA